MDYEAPKIHATSISSSSLSGALRWRCMKSTTTPTTTPTTTHIETPRFPQICRRLDTNRRHRSEVSSSHSNTASSPDPPSAPRSTSFSARLSPSSTAPQFSSSSSAPLPTLSHDDDATTKSKKERIHSSSSSNNTATKSNRSSSSLLNKIIRQPHLRILMLRS